MRAFKIFFIVELRLMTSLQATILANRNSKKTKFQSSKHSSSIIVTIQNIQFLPSKYTHSDIVLYELKLVII